jgi:hypothetical protein
MNRKINYKLWAIIVILMAVLIAAYSVYKDSQFRLLSTNPAVNNLAAVAPSIMLNYNKPLAITSVVVTSKQHIISSYQVSSKSIIINFNSALNLNTSYAIYIQSVKDTAGEAISNQSIMFIPKDISAQQLTKMQQEALLKKQVNATQTENNGDPILKYLPYSTLDYSLTTSYITSATSATQLVINAQLVIDQADMDTAQDTDAAVASKKAEVIQHIQSLGLNPSNYDIQYTY